MTAPVSDLEVLALAALLVGVAALTKYFAVSLVPLLLVYGLIRRKKTGAWTLHLLIPIAGEASHGGFAPESNVQIEMLSVLRERYDRVSSERFVSGPGLENIYWALCRLHDEQRPQLKASEIFAKATDRSDPRAAEAVQMFFEMLGQFAGDFALALGAKDGIFIAGGIVRRDRRPGGQFSGQVERAGHGQI